jgi:Lipocalin-like domain
MQSSVLGVWKLRSYSMENVETKERTEPFGAEPRGSLILHPDGRMMALIAPAPAPGVDRAAPSPRLVAYSGRFRLEPPDRLVTSVDVAGFEDWIGTEQTRTYTLDGDRLELLTPRGRMPREGGEAVNVFGILSFSREAPTPTGAPGPGAN